jgi:hypothetical protein
LPFVASAILRIMRLKYVFYSNYKRLSHQIEYRRSDLFALRQGRSALTLGCWSAGAVAHCDDGKACENARA